MNYVIVGVALFYGNFPIALAALPFFTHGWRLKAKVLGVELVNLDWRWEAE
jgi:hypothetical protein